MLATETNRTTLDFCFCFLQSRPRLFSKMFTINIKTNVLQYKAINCYLLCISTSCDVLRWHLRRSLCSNRHLEWYSSVSAPVRKELMRRGGNENNLGDFILNKDRDMTVSFEVDSRFHCTSHQKCSEEQSTLRNIESQARERLERDGSTKMWSKLITVILQVSTFKAVLFISLEK